MTSDERLTQLRTATAWCVRERAIHQYGRTALVVAGIFLFFGYIALGTATEAPAMIILGGAILVTAILILRTKNRYALLSGAAIMVSLSLWFLLGYLIEHFTEYSGSSYTLVGVSMFAMLAYGLWRCTKVPGPVDGATLSEVDRYIEDAKWQRVAFSFEDIAFTAESRLWDAVRVDDLVFLIRWDGTWGKRRVVTETYWLRPSELQVESIEEDPAKGTIIGRVRIGSYKVVERARMSAEIYRSLRALTVTN